MNFRIVSDSLSPDSPVPSVVPQISRTTVWRWLAADALRPWQHRTWIFPRDPDFAGKAQRILDLYQRLWEGVPLQENDFVISADEKTSVQARRRKQPTLSPAPQRVIGSNTSIFGRAHGPIWQPGTSIGPSCSGAARPRAASPLPIACSLRS